MNSIYKTHKKDKNEAQCDKYERNVPGLLGHYEGTDADLDFQIAIVFVKTLSLGICSTGNARARRGWHCIGVRGRGTRRGSSWLGRSGCGGISGGRLGFFTTAGKEGSESFLSFR